MDSLIRKYVFWMLDFLNGSNIRHNLKSIENVIDKKNTNEKQLEEILMYTAKESEYYKNIDPTNLNNFPVVNKSILQKEYDKILIGSKNERGLHWTCTSGSTGIPLKLPQNKEKRIRTKADLIYFNKKAGWNIGDKYVFIRSWVNLYKMSKLRIIAQNFVIFDTNKFNDDEMMRLRKLLKKDRKIKCILGYSSAITSFVKYLNENKDNASMFNIKLVVTASDELTQRGKDEIRKMFDCKVINRISNEEHGLLAMNFDTDDYFTLNTASYYFELLKLNSDLPAECGEIGRLVVTDLFNKKFPLIRYDIGDLAVGLAKDKNGSISLLKSFEGRGRDIIYNTKGVPITCVTLSTHICTNDNIKKYQLVVSKDKKKLKVVVENKNVELTQLKKEMCQLFGDDNFEIEIVENIEIEKNGKYKVIKKEEYA